MATTATANKRKAAESKFDWPLCYEAENFILERIDAFIERNQFTRALAKRMREETGTLILDWTDHLLLPAGDEKKLREVGFVEDPLGETKDRHVALWHPEAMLPVLDYAEAMKDSDLMLMPVPKAVIEEIAGRLSYERLH